MILVFFLRKLWALVSLLSQVFLGLEEIGFTINLLKYAWGVQSTDNLGYLLATDGIKPLPHKIEAISRISQPTSTTHI